MEGTSTIGAEDSSEAEDDEISGAEMRIYKPAKSRLTKFSGRNLDEDKGRSWYVKIRAVFEIDRCSALEMCQQFPMMLKGPTRDWYHQLPCQDRTSWKALSDRFQRQYCGKGAPKLKQYYLTCHQDGEDPLDYLYRLNTAAIRARVRLHNGSPEERKEHVEHYIDTLQDDSLADGLTKL